MLRKKMEWKIYMVFLAILVNDFNLVVVADAISCYVCSSDKLEACSRDYQKNDVELPFEQCLNNVAAACYTKVEDGITHRGCTTLNSQFQWTVKCDKTNECVKCYKDKCNGNSKDVPQQNESEELKIETKPPSKKVTFHEDLSKEVARNVDTDNQMTCIVCNSVLDPTCKTNENFKNFERCPEPHKCYHYINAITGEHKRGCTKNLEELMLKKCEENDDECKTCQSKNCNAQSSFKKCLNCKMILGEDLHCAANPDLVHSKVCKAYNDKCYTSIENYSLSRGCMSDKDEIFHKECLKNSDKCGACTTGGGNGCNNQRIFTDKCVACDSGMYNYGCDTKPEVYKDKICNVLTSSKPEGCYLRVEGDHYQRGCVRDLGYELKQNCMSQSDACKTCDGENCNQKPDFPECYECNSKNDLGCSGNTTLTKSKICENYKESCVTGIDAFGYTHRRCSKGNERKEFTSNRHSTHTWCQGKKCNSNIFPDTRIQCYQCNGEDDCELNHKENDIDSSVKSLQATPCRIYSKDDQCYAFLSEDNKFTRGCLSDNTDISTRCRNNNPDKTGICFNCAISGCNDAPKVRRPILSCIQCNKSKECAYGHDQGTAIQCKNDIPFSWVESCYTHFNAAEGWAERGCTLDIEGNSPFNEDTKHIDLCMEPGCNSENILYSHCIMCKSGLDGDCATITYPIIQTKQCIGTYSHEKRGCYTMVKDETISRGCVKDLDENDIAFSQNDERSTICTENMCNQEDIKPSKEELCYACDSKTDLKCVKRLDSSMLTKCPESEQPLGCFHTISDNQITRGCVANLEEPVKTKCLANDKTCKTCFGKGCNEKPAFAECVATKGALNINYKPKFPLDENFFSKICKNYNDKCFVFINDKKKVTRDCLSEYLQDTGVSPQFLSENYNVTSYEVCAEPLCNDQIVQQIQCFSCDSRNDKNCMDTTLVAKKECPLEINAPRCYHIEGDGEKLIERGCITDLDEKNRKLCESNGDTCKICFGSECNSKPSFQRCVNTNENDPNNIGTKICKRYDDKCFIHVSGKTIRRGCMNDLIESPINGVNIVLDCRTDEICETCSGVNNCNHREVTPEKCIVCSSKDDVDCTYNPTTNLSQSCPLTLKPIGCYLKKDVIYQSERGCISQLDDIQRRECDRSDGPCKKCLSDNCNEKPYFQTCAECSTQNDGEKCIDKAYFTRAVTCSDYHGDCYTLVQHGNVRRSCVGDIHVPNADACEKNSENCKLCAGKGVCNDDNITPLTCVSCDATVNPSCAKNTTFHEFITCPISVHPQTCYHSIDTIGVHKRGCTDQLSQQRKTYCEKNLDFCKTCSQSKCNTRLSYEKCFQCNSTIDAGCLDMPEMGRSGVCSKYSDEMCYTRIGKDSIERGCMSDQSLVGQHECKHKSNKCSTCSTGTKDVACNNNKIKMEHCVECDSKKDEHCIDKPGLYGDKICSEFIRFSTVGNREGCYVRENGNHTVRGCVRDLQRSHKDDCVRQSKTCKTCFGKNCNTKSIQKCYFTSGEHHFQSHFKEMKTCKHYNDACFVLITEKQTVVKDCLKEYADKNSLSLNFLSETYKNSSYSVCSSALCNDQVIESTNCITCDSRHDLYCDGGPFSHSWRRYRLRSCPLEVYSSGCFHYNGNHTLRGCVNGLVDEKRFSCESDSDICKKCIGIECNDLITFQKCLTGNERKAADSQSKICKRYSDECFIHIANDTIQRGCSSDLIESPTKEIDFLSECQNGRCKTCAGRENCNDIDIKDEHCLVCQGTSDCSFYPGQDMRQKCPLAILPMGCYLHRTTHSNVERGCISQLDVANQKECQDGSYRCKMCRGDSCNIKRDFQRCHACYSKDGNENDQYSCRRKPWNVKEVVCPNYTDECYTLVQEGSVQRNCIGDETFPNATLCKEHPNYCQTCSDKRSCNDSPLKYQTCISCDSSVDPTCATNSTFEATEQCPLWIHPQICYHHIDNKSGVHERGCFNTLSKPMMALCKANGNECKTCRGENCNSESAFSKCIQCSSIYDSNCGENPMSTATVTCTEYNDECFTHIGKVELLRGCLNNQKPTFIEKVRRDPRKFSTCNTNDGTCNNHPIKIEMCNECFTKNGDDCLNNPDLYKDRICNEMDSTEEQGCYVEFMGDDSVKRGCVRDLNPLMKHSCLEQVDGCKSCVGDNCNRMKEFRNCYVNNENSESFQPLKLPENWKDSTKICKEYDDKCISFVNETGFIIKDCLADHAEKNDVPINFYNENHNSSVYRECLTSLCNDENIEPLWCIGCDSEDDPNCNGSAFTPRVRCPLEVESSGCYHYNDGANVKRGCIADLNKETRELCESDSDKCKKCMQSDCNWRPAFQKCITTNPENIDKSQSKTCKRYNDQCFIHVSNEMIHRGCMSDIVESAVDGIGASDCDNGEICLKCDYIDDCNAREIENEHCVICSSTDDKHCVNHPKQLKKRCPLALNEMGCFLNTDGYSTVERGCVSQLSATEREDCGKGNVTCKTCIGDSCNEKRSFQTCYECDSEVDGKFCIHAAYNVKDRECPNYLDQCYTLVEDGIVKRNCTGDDTIPDIAKCKTISDKCKICDDKRGCNYHEVEKQTCVSCNSKDDPTCVTNTTFTSIDECPLAIYHHNHHQCYHYINPENGEHTRGCTKNLDGEMKRLCEQRSPECKTCLGNNCNREKSFTTCLHCATSNDPHCAKNPYKVFKKICSAYKDECFTFIGSLGVSRGCMSERSETFKKDCRKNRDKCSICSNEDSEGCNDNSIVMETCLACDSITDPNCKTNPTVFGDKICSGIEETPREGCYLRVENVKDGENEVERYERGCVRDLNEELRTDCLSQSDTCKTCEGKNCNKKKEFQQCITCDSRDDSECSRDATSQSSVMCQNYLSTCVTGIDAHGHTRRRCSRQYKDEDIDFPNNQFQVCKDNKCNTGIYPANRLQCYRCDGKDDCDFMPSHLTALENSSWQLAPCDILSEFDQCYAYLSENNKIYRGCLTDTSEGRLLCERNNPHDKSICIKCGASGCNNVPRVQPPTLSCVHCDKSNECAFGQDKSTAIACKNEVPFGSDETCYTYYSFENKGWAQRGCSLDVNKISDFVDNNESVKFCSKSGCNTENILHSNCVTCKSDLRGKCARISDPEGLLLQCKGTYPHDQRGCYTIRRNETVHRGCIKDLDQTDFEACKDDKKHKKCTICLDDTCNVNTISSTTKMSVNGLIIALIISVIYFN